MKPPLNHCRYQAISLIILPSSMSEMANCHQLFHYGLIIHTTPKSVAPPNIVVP
jgi:hypothetical protein